MSGADHASLVEQIKQLETDPEANRQWHAYADAHGRGTYDPALHDATFLQAFLSSYQGGTTGQQQPGATSDPEHARLVEQIKNMERTDAEASQKWISYCDRNGGGTRDPALHGVAFLKAFLSSYDSIVTGFQPGAPTPTDPEHASLVEQIKQLERTDPAAAQKWVSYADTQGGGSRDPARHDKAFLLAFLQLQGQVADKRELKAAMAGTEPAEVAEQVSGAGGA